jgi:thiamine-phosphate pyrophosphorylase
MTPLEVFLAAISPGRGDGDELARVLPRLREGGVDLFVLREKELAPAARERLARRLRPLALSLGLPFWVAEDVELARSVAADGVHLSERSASASVIRAGLPEEIALALSLHDPVRRSSAELELARHAFLAPLFPTPSKPGGGTLPLPRFVALARALPLPVFALGGIGPEELPLLAAAGVTRVAAIRLFFAAGDPRRAAEEARRLLTRGAEERGP